MRGNNRAKDFISYLKYEDRTISSLSIMELMQGCLNREEQITVKRFVRENFSSVIHPDEEISEKAILLIERYSLSHGLRTIDSLLAASALLTGSSIATANLKHYKNIPNLKVLQFSP